MNKYKQLGKNTLVVFIGNMGSKLIALFMLPFYTGWLSVDEFGISDSVTIYSTLLIGLVTLSISESIFIFPKDKKYNDQRNYFSSGLIYTLLLLIVGGIMLAGINYFLETIDILESFTENTLIIYILIVSTFFQTFTQQFTRSINKINIYALSGVVLTLTTAFSAFILIPIYKLQGFFYSQILSLLVSGTFTFFASKSYEFLSIRAINRHKYWEMIKYSIPLIPNAIIWWVVASINRPILEEYAGVYSIGIFAVANKLPSLINVMFSVFMVSWQASVLEEFKKEGYPEFYNKIFKALFTLLAIVVLFLTFFGEILNGFITDVKFSSAWMFIPYLSIAGLFASISGFVGANFSAVRKSKFYFYSSIWGALAAIILNLILIPLFGLFGAVIAVVGAHLTMAISRVYYANQYVRISNLRYHLTLLGLVIFCALLVGLQLGIICNSMIFLLILTIMVYSVKSEIGYYGKKILSKYLRSKS